jgi:sigma-B regulation protein RsbU (phosphoserine phosphatase)
MLGRVHATASMTAAPRELRVLHRHRVRHQTALMRHRLRCSEVWGGVKDEDVDADSAGLHASLYSRSCDGGGRGGDVYYFSVCDADSLTRLAVADVVGHGAAVSDVSAWLFEAMRERMNDLAGNGVLEQLNALAAERGMRAMTTAAVAAFYRDDSNFHFSYAGHHAALVWRREGRDRTWREATLGDRDGGNGDVVNNLPLGVLADAVYEQASIVLSPGDRLALYTDGIIEARNPDGELFGLPRLRATLDRHAAESPAAIKRAVLDAVDRHTAQAPPDDDMTLLIVEVR